MSAVTVAIMAATAQVHVGEVVSEVMERHAITQQQLADVMGRGRTTVAAFLQRPSLSWRVLEDLADALNAICAERGFPQRYSAASLQQGSDPANAVLAEVPDDRAALRAELAELRRLVVRETVAIPCYGPAPCGTPLLLDEEPEPEAIDLADLIDDPIVPGRHLLLRADGDSMKPFINDGDLMVVDRNRVPALNEIVAANWNSSLTVKRIAPHPDTGEPCLMPDNPAHDPILIDDGDEVEVIGVVIGVLRRYISLTGAGPIARAQQTRRRKR